MIAMSRPGSDSDAFQNAGDDADIDGLTIGMIYMAGGNGQRFSQSCSGANKLLTKIGGKPMFRWGLDALAETALQIETCDSGIRCEIVVVTQYPEISEACEGPNVRCVLDDSCRLGASWSVKAGMQPLLNTDYMLFLAADQPGVSADTIASMIHAAVYSKAPIGCVTFQEEDCNPCLFHRSLYPELMALEGDRGGKRVLKKHPEYIARVEAASDREIADIDTMEDLKEYLNGGC